MAKRMSQSSGSQALRPRARILRTLGDELISSETVALIELVKNSYDANATRVLIRFEGPLEEKEGRIEVIDNGHGMALETIQTAWMEPATLFKRQRRSYSEGGRRRVLGEKGIGRFAASRLASFLEVVTRRVEMDHEVRVLFDWSQFDDEDKYLDEIEVLWEKAQPSEICPGGTIESLWVENDGPKPKELSHGTILRIQDLRTKWDQDQLYDLRKGLSRLISPVFDHAEKKESDEFQIRLQVPQPFEHLSGIVQPPETLTNPHHAIHGDVKANGEYELSVKLKGQTRWKSVKGRHATPDGRKPECGPFHIELRVWDRDTSAMKELAEAHDSSIRDVRRDLDEAAGINVYRDGFRVLPYGEPRNDWLRLDLRRVQNPTLRLSNNQIVGYVLISADKNPQLRDQSNREGLIEGPALNDLRELVKQVLSELETRRYAIRPRRDKAAPQAGGLFTGFDLHPIRDLITERHPEDKELLTVIGEKEEDLERRVEEVQQVLARYRRLATLGQLIDTILHDSRTPLSKINKEASLGERDLERAGKVIETLLEKLRQRFSLIVSQSDVLATVFRRIEPFGGRKRGRPEKVHLEDVIRNAFAVLETDIQQVGASASLPETTTEVTVDPAEIQEVIINLLQNSLYWLLQKPQGERKIQVRVVRKDSGEVAILFADSGPGVDAEFRDRIFEPYFSTKPNGVGLGLTIAGDIVADYYNGTLELLDKGPLSGATFRITLRTRV